MESNKHAYLIMAHNAWGILEKQLKLLDHERNDLYIHIDKKAADFDFAHFQSLVKRSGIFFSDRLDVRWGDYSQIQCEIMLLKMAAKGRYQYYHLLSGVDLPLKTQNEIHDFFDGHQGKEFIHFSTRECVEKYSFRVRQYHFPRMYTSKWPLMPFCCRAFNFLLRRTQSAIGYQRPWEEDFPLQCGSNWFSITHPLAEYVIEMEPWVKKRFHHTFCADELFLQTLVFQSPFFSSVYQQEFRSFEEDCGGCMRLIDWKRGRPYVFRSEDFQLLTESGMLFARKFREDPGNDADITEQIFAHLTH